MMNRRPKMSQESRELRKDAAFAQQMYDECVAKLSQSQYVKDLQKQMEESITQKAAQYAAKLKLEEEAQLLLTAHEDKKPSSKRVKN